MSRINNKFIDLPADIYRLLTDYLSGKDICKFRKINKLIHKAINNRYLWSLIHQELTEHDERLPITNILLELDEKYHLYEALEKGYEKKVKYFVEKTGHKGGLNDGTFVIRGREYTYLSIPTIHGYLDIVKYLVSEGINIDAEKEELLSVAAENGNIDIIKYLVSLGADIHIFGEQALNRAAKANQIETVKYLVSQGADLNGINQITISHLINTKNINMLRYIIETAAGVYNEDNMPSEEVIGGYLKIIRNSDKIPDRQVIDDYLKIIENIYRHYNTNQLNGFILRYIAQNNYIDVLKYLLSEGSPNIDDSLMFASSFGRLGMIKYILSLGADIHYDDDIALRIAFSHNQIDAVIELLNHGADIHVNDDELLINAVNEDNLDMIKILLAHGEYEPKVLKQIFSQAIKN